jgi:hypothetical protein
MIPDLDQFAAFVNQPKRSGYAVSEASLKLVRSGSAISYRIDHLASGWPLAVFDS